jgi:hypothetical protein
MTMIHLPTLCLGAALTLAATWLISAAAPLPADDMPAELMAGSTVFGFNVLAGTGQALAGLEASTPVTIRELRGSWLRVDYPTQKTGPVWVNSSALVSFRTDR